MYSVDLFDRAGQFSSSIASTFAACLVLVRELSVKHPDKALVVTNLDRNDYDHDGLTDDERDAIDEVR